MSFSCINFLKEDIRLIKYESCIYKIKILYEDEEKLKNCVPDFSQKEAHDELEQVIRAILHSIKNKDNIDKLQTNRFLIGVKIKQWKASQKLGFRQNGLDITSHPFVIILNVKLKSVQESNLSKEKSSKIVRDSKDQTPAATSKPRDPLIKEAQNSNVRVSLRKLPPPTQKEPEAQSKKCANVLADEFLSTQAIELILEEADKLGEKEKCERLEKEKAACLEREQQERFAKEYAEQVVRDQTIDIERPKSPLIKTSRTNKKHEGFATRKNEEKQGDEPQMTEKSQAPKSVASTSPQKQKPTISPNKVTGTSMSLRKRKRSSSLNKDLSPRQGEKPTEKITKEKRIAACNRKVQYDKRSSLHQKSNVSSKDNTVKNKDLPNEKPRDSTVKNKALLHEKPRDNTVKNKDLSHGKPKVQIKDHSLLENHQKIISESDESETKRLKLQLMPDQIATRRSPRIRQKHILRNTNNNSCNIKAKSPGISVSQLHKTRKDRHFIEQEELAEDMKLQQLAKSSPNPQSISKLSLHHKRKSGSGIWGMMENIISPVKNIFS